MRTGRNEYAAVNARPPATISGAGQCNRRLAPSASTGGDARDDDHLGAGTGAGDERAARVGGQVHPVDAFVGEVVDRDGEQQRRDHGDERLREQRTVVGTAGLREPDGGEHPDEDHDRGPGENDDQDARRRIAASLVARA